MMDMKSMLILGLSLFSIGTYAQTGPAGVGTTDGASTLEVWYVPEQLKNASNVLPSDGETVSTWSDNSGNGFTLTNSGTATFESAPGDLINGLPLVKCTSLNRQFSTGSNVTGKVIIVVGNASSATGVEGFVGFNGDKGIRRTGGTSGSSWNNGDANDWCGVAGSYLINGTAGLNHGNVHHQTLGDRSTSYTDIFYAGGYYSSRPFSGDLSEIIVYSASLNSAEQIILQNYLSAKYAIALTSNDIYTQDDAGGYDFEVAGIGRVDVSNLQNTAQGTGMVSISSPADLGDNEFLMWGHDNGIAQASETSDVPTGIDARLDRVWRVSEVNTSGTAVDVGGISIDWDLTGLGSVTASDLRLLVDTNNDGAFSDADATPISGASLISGNTYGFSGVTAIANNLRFTLGTIDDTQTPLPVELVSFTAEVFDNNQVRLNWITSLEVNNDYFSIERSKEGVNWLEVERIQSITNSSSVHEYSTFDLNPQHGLSYYRLSQTDLDGNTTVFAPRSVYVETLAGEEDITVYPNPTQDQFTIIGNENELSRIEVLDVLGQHVSDRIREIRRDPTSCTIDVSDLNRGVYYVMTLTQTRVVYIQ